jgi:hypothetical protein
MTQIPDEYRTLANSDRPPEPGIFRVGSADPKATLSASILVRRRPDGPPSPSGNILAATSPPQRLSREEFAASYGAAQADLDQVAAFAQGQGLTVMDTNAARRTVVVSGTVEQMNKAFAVDLGQYQSPSGTRPDAPGTPSGPPPYRGYDGPVRVPANLGDIVEGVFGLDNRQLGRPAIVSADATPAIPPLTPPDVARLYQFPTLSATGQTIGIIEFGGGYQLSDVQDYFNNVVNLPVPSVTSVSVGGATNSPGGGADIEVILDICVAGSVAPGANIVVYFAPNNEQGMIDVITTVLNDTTNKPSVLSISYVSPDVPSTTSISSVMSDFKEIGVTVFAASGDYGSGTGVSYFATDPWVTGCGGTTVENVSGTSFTEVAWAGSTGGISNVFPLPEWQKLAGIPPSVTSSPPGHVGRGVPDIAGNGDPNTGYTLILNGASTSLWGGTSAVAPLYAGFTALLNATLGESVGYLNYDLYSPVGPYPYNDVTSGSNGGYSASSGWDAVTGWGSINGSVMVRFLPVSVTVSPNPLCVQGAATGTVVFSQPAPEDTQVEVTTSDPSGVVVPASVPVPAGATSVTFPITATASAPSCVINAAANGRSVSVDVAIFVGPMRMFFDYPGEGPPLTPGTSGVFTIFVCNPAPVGGGQVSIANSNPSDLEVPTSVSIPASATSVSFNAVSLAESVLRIVTVTATYEGISESATVSVGTGIVHPPPPGGGKPM